MRHSDWQLTRFQRLTYSAGMFSAAIVTANVMGWLLYFYSPPPNAVDAGMPFLAVGVLVGAARLLGSAVDAFTNPVVAFWSDRSRNPRGRRIPFIRRGTIPLMIFAILVWFPPVRGASDWNVAWLAYTLCATWFFYTYVVAPYLAMMPEVTTNPKERVSLTVTMSYFEAGAMVIAALVVPVVIEKLKNGVQVGPLWIADGFKVTAIALALLGGAGFFLATSFVREKKLPAEKISTLSFKGSVVACFRNPAFPPYLVAVASAKIAVGLVLISMPFVATAVLHKGEGFTAMLQAPLFVSTLLGFLVAQVVANRLGLKVAFRGAVLVALLVTLGIFFVYFAGGTPKELASFTVLPDRDIVMQFGEEGKRSQEQLASPSSVEVEGDLVTVRMTHLEWLGLFGSLDEERFRRHIQGLDAKAAARLIRGEAVERVGGDAKRWLLDSGPKEWLQVLKPEARPLLFPEAKRRFDEALYFSQLRQVGPIQPGGEVVLALDAGLVLPMAKTYNLDGWTSILSSAEERVGMAAATTWRMGTPTTVKLKGHIRYSDGSVVFTDFHIADPQSVRIPGITENSAAANQFEKLAFRDGELDHLLSRFDLRVERTWSVRIWLMLGMFFLLGFPVAILMSMYRPIVCEIVDLDEKRVGTRREAMYFGVEGLLTKLADGVSALIAPAVMVVGHAIAAPPFGFIFPFAAAAVFLLIAYAVFGRYPLGKRVSSLQ